MNELLEKQNPVEYFEEKHLDSEIEAKLLKKRTHILLDKQRLSLEDIITKYSSVMQANIRDMIKIYLLLNYSLDNASIFETSLTTAKCNQSIIKSIINGTSEAYQQSKYFNNIKNLIHELRIHEYTPIEIHKSLTLNKFKKPYLSELLSKPELLSNTNLEFLTSVSSAQCVTKKIRIKSEGSKYKVDRLSVKRNYLLLFTNINRGLDYIQKLLPGYNLKTLKSYISMFYKLERNERVDNFDLFKKVYYEYKKDLNKSDNLNNKGIDESTKISQEFINQDIQEFILISNNQIITQSSDKSYMLGYQKAYNDLNECNAKLYILTEL